MRCFSPTVRLATWTRRSTVEPALGHDRLDPAARARAVAERLPHRLGAEHDVVEAVEVLGEREVLVHHADAGRERRAGRAVGQGVERAAVVGDADDARLRHIVAEEDVHQRRLAGAVLAEKREDLALVERQVDGVVGERARRNAW